MHCIQMHMQSTVMVIECRGESRYFRVGFPYHSSGLLISQLSLMVTINFYHPLI